jgi:thymidylate kinase
VSPLARAALRERIRGRLASPPLRPRRGVLIALSGMDGAGKSTAAQALSDVLGSRGLQARVEWARLGNAGEPLGRVARPVKRLLRARGTVADPVAAGGPGLEHAAGEPRRGGVVAWVWILYVALVAAGSQRRAARGVARGDAVVCDRWLADSLVDLRLRYGRRRAAEWLLRALVPGPDVAILLAIDARASLARKPGDQAERVLEQMEHLYAAVASDNRLAVVDALRPLDQVTADVVAIAEHVLAL